MVAHLVRLRFRILFNTLRKSVWQLIAVMIGALYGLVALVVLVGLLISLSFGELQLANTVIVLGGAVAVLGWWIVPLLATGIDQTVDPARLATFPIPRRTLLMAMAVSGVLGIPGIITAVASLAAAAAWWRYPLAALAGVLCAAIGVLICVVGSRMFAAVVTSIGSGRRMREAKGLIVIVPAILLGPILIGLSALLESSFDMLPRLAQTLAWTPLGAVWAVPGSIASGQFAAAGAQLLIALATLGALTALWWFALARALESPAASTSAKGASDALGLFRFFPATPTGAVAARALTYWLRDPRYAQSLVVVPLVPLLLWFYSGSTDSPVMLLAIGPIIGLMLAVTLYTDVSYDHTAYALHLQTGVSGVADRLGRVIAMAVFAVPVTILFTVLPVWLTGQWWTLPGLLGISLGMLLTGFGLSSVLSGAFVFSVPKPGESPFKSRPGGGFSLMLSSFATWGALAVLAAPEVVLALIGFATEQVMLGWVSLIVGLVLGSILLVIGVRWGGRILEQRGPSLLAALQPQK